ncbi:MAG: hypothetical protein HeimC2_25970 [Candidatus Heimdallarchaeota archaeon LC_2]|nr:MAG: hypothetical protein HeimC2_25970 [Candidatus Heimdallarchaeota archaeon LC_2]
MSELEGIALTIYDEVMDEIHEETQDAFENLLTKELIESLVSKIQELCASKVKETIVKYFSNEMSSVKKLILGERIARVVTAIAKEELREMIATITEQSFNVLDEFRNEIIGEVFEETEQ